MAFSFNLPVGAMRSKFFVRFQAYKRTGLIIDVNARVREDITLTMANNDEVVVSDTAGHVETESSQMGEVVTGTQITAVALTDGVSTDLLSASADGI